MLLILKYFDGRVSWKINLSYQFEFQAIIFIDAIGRSYPDQASWILIHPFQLVARQAVLHIKFADGSDEILGRARQGEGKVEQ